MNDWIMALILIICVFAAVNYIEEYERVAFENKIKTESIERDLECTKISENLQECHILIEM